MDVKEVVLKYSIHKCSSCSSSYLPENIIIDDSTDQSSRWSSDTNNPPQTCDLQYITLTLDKPAIFTSIKFGKYEKTHVCNLKKFLVYAGLKENHMIEVLDSGLRNDNNSESFRVKNRVNGNLFPVRFIKIVPIQSWGNSFNFSIWHVQIRGNESNIKNILAWYKKHREDETIRLCLKHFRQKNFTAAFEALKITSGVMLESDLVADLHHHLVVKGDFTTTEDLLNKAMKDGLFDGYASGQDYNTEWQIIESEISMDPDVPLSPGMRGGHQLAIDPVRSVLYLYGGWDGSKDLADLWSFDINTSIWTCICQDTEKVGGPSARSCHKMVVDQIRKRMFVLGRYLESSMRTRNIKSDFYMYDIDTDKWTQLSDDTDSMGGPVLIFDHQMVFDSENQYLYVFGGKSVQQASTNTRQQDMQSLLCTTNLPDNVFSGLYRYYVPTNTWTNLRIDCTELKSRIAHSMLFHPKNKSLYIFAGQRCKEYLNDFLIYHTDTDTVDISPVCNDGSIREYSQGAQGTSGYTQRATIDCESNEIHVLSGLSKDKEKKDSVRNSFWVYYMNQNKWSCIYRNDNISSPYEKPVQHIEPVPRFAHQLVYDEVKKVHYLFGGNPGKDNSPSHRLDDFWTLKLQRPPTETVLHKCRFMIRKQQFLEIAQTDSTKALSFLQSDLSSVINHSDNKEIEQFQELACHLFNKELLSSEDQPSNAHYRLRSILFDHLMMYFPSDMVQPEDNLLDLVKIQI